MFKKVQPVLRLINKSTTSKRCLTAAQQVNGVNFNLTEEQIEFRDAARKFVDEKIIPNAAEWDQKNIYPAEFHKQAHELGFYSIGIPEKYGGLGKGLVDISLINETLSIGCTGFTTTMFVNELALAPLHMHGSEELKMKYMSRSASESIVAAYCVTEPNTGSDVAGVKTYAKKDADGNWILNGAKQWISNGGVANWYFVLARTNPDLNIPASKAMTGFIVEGDSKGLTYGKKEKNMGQRASDTRAIQFEDVKIPKENVVGGEGNGFKVAMGAFDCSRPVVAACATGLAQRCMEESGKYALERKAFGQEIANFQAVQFMLADMAISIETARLAYLRASWEFDQNRKNTYWSSIAKSYAADAANKCATDAVQIFGGAGFNSEYPVEKLMRDAKIFQIYEGTREVQKIVVGREVLKQAKAKI